MSGDDTSTHEQWLEWRTEGIGASDVAAAATGRYGGATKVVAQRLGIVVDEIDPELADRGHRWEQPIGDMVHVATGMYVVGEQAWLEHPENRRRRATVDGFLAHEPEVAIEDVVALLEVKTRSPHAPWPWDYWEAQTQTQMDIAGLDRCLLAIATIDEVLHPQTLQLDEQLVDLKLRWVDADPFAQAELAELAERLITQVDAGVLPEPTDAAALPYVKLANATADDEASADIDDLAELLDRYDELKAAAKAADKERATAEAAIRHRMGEATEALTTDGRWRVRLGHPVMKFTSQSEADFIELHGDEHPELLRTVLDRNAAKEAMPEEYEALRIATPDRRLTTKRMTTEEDL